MNIVKANETHVIKIHPLFVELMNYHSVFHTIFEYDPDEITEVGIMLSEYINGKDTEIFIAELNGEIYGYIMCRKIVRSRIFRLKRKGAIEGMFVPDKFRNLKVGARLFEEALKWFSDVDYIELQYTNGNEVAERFWINQGFERVNQFCIKSV